MKSTSAVGVIILLLCLCLPQLVFAASLTITALSTSGGSISPKGTVKIPANGSKTFTIKPAKGHILADVLVNGESKGRVSSYTFQNQNTNAWIQAVFVDTRLFLEDGNIVVNDPTTGGTSSLATAMARLNMRLVAVEQGIPAQDGKIPASSVSFDPRGTLSPAKTVQEALLEARLKREDFIGTWNEYQMDGDELYDTEGPTYSVTFRDDGTFTETGLTEEYDGANEGTWSLEKGLFFRWSYSDTEDEWDDEPEYNRVQKISSTQMIFDGWYFEKVQ